MALIEQVTISLHPKEKPQDDGADYDEDGLSDRMETTQYGTDFDNNDTDGDGLLDGWEVANGLDPLDDGDADFAEIESSSPPRDEDTTTGENNETFLTRTTDRMATPIAMAFPTPKRHCMEPTPISEIPILTD